MRYLRKLFFLLLSLLIGFWLGTSGILQGTTVGNWMETIVSYFPTSADIEQFNQNGNDLPFLSESFFEGTEDEEPVEAPDVSSEEAEKLDVSLIEETVIVLVNELREDLDVPPVASNDMLRSAATIRAIETEEQFSHTRPDGTDAFTVFDEEGIHYPYQTAGENLGMATYHLQEEQMAELIFNGWVDSQGHYENMIRSDFEEIGVGVHYDEEFLYITQLFGTQR
ncbi:MAG: CAP domain-containing protein [Alkalibacterium sp.]|nr:CAP domain-containing protein [Alkalibacterium sp.]TVP90867.1 MAG: CAP domain-containing protein [Alkalibacterium sp.]